MLRMTRVCGSLLAVLVLTGATASVANAFPMGKLVSLHPHSAQTQDARITVHVYNKGSIFQDLKVAGKTYTVLPHQGLEIKAAAGTEVYAESTSFAHRKGDLLFAVTPAMKDTTISIN
jgi:hypothetical protein